MKNFVIAACLAAAAFAASPSKASVISSTPTLPVLGAPYHASAGAGCFPLAGVCIVPGNITPTSLVSSTFDALGQDIVTNVSYTGTLTNLASVPLGPINLTGTLEQEILGRFSATAIGTWVTELVSLSLSGPVLGHTLSVGLDGTTPSTGESSIEDLSTQDVPKFRIDSFFDVFVELNLDSVPPLHTTRGPIRLTLVPEPATMSLFGLALVALGFLRRRRTSSDASNAGRK